MDANKGYAVRNMTRINAHVFGQSSHLLRAEAKWETGLARKACTEDHGQRPGGFIYPVLPPGIVEKLGTLTSDESGLG